MNKAILVLAVLFSMVPCQAQRLEPMEDSVPPVMLHGKAEKEHTFNLNDKRQGRLDKDSSLNGNATTNSISDEDQALLIAWDKWRNKFNRKVWVKLNERLSGGPFFAIGPLAFTLGEGSGYNFKRGIETTYVCDVNNDRTISNLRVLSPSGDPLFDRLVISCVASLNGKSSLEFPEGSKRTRVKMSSILKIGRPVFHETVYNDNEHVNVSKFTD